LLLLIIRHGEAEPKSSAKRDEDRALTNRGTETLRANLKVAKELLGDRKVDFILSSTLLRAKQSAEIAREVFRGPSPAISDALHSDSETIDVYKAISKLDSFNVAVLVTHQPLVSRLLAHLLNWNDRNFRFETGSIAIVELSEMRINPEGVLISLVQPLS
jgi:phosphohistidine phosphatase